MSPSSRDWVRESAWTVADVLVGVVFLYLYQEPSTPKWLVPVAGISAFFLIFLHIYSRVRRSELGREAGQEREEKSALQAKIAAEHKDEQVALLSRINQFSTTVLRALTEELRTIGPTKTPSLQSLNIVRRSIFRHLFRELRSVFESDPRGRDTTTWPYNFFKIALFVPAQGSTGARCLKRLHHDYPEGREPSPETEWVEIDKHPRAAHVLAFTNQNIEVVEDIKAEDQKPVNVKRWVNLREGQSQDYESMVCAAIVSGRRGEDDRKCLGVLVIDTNRSHYFLENRDFEVFLGNLLNPPRTILTLLLELHTYYGLPDASDR